MRPEQASYDLLGGMRTIDRDEAARRQVYTVMITKTAKLPYWSCAICLQHTDILRYYVQEESRA